MSRRDPQSRSFSADRLGAALREVGGSARPEYLDNIVAQAQDTRQRPAWTLAERWLPVDITARPAGLPRAAVFFALFLLTLALVAATAFFAGTLRAPATPLDATNGLIAYVSGTDIVAVQPDGTGRHTLVEGAGSAGAGSVGSISFSPEGRRFAYWTFRGLAWDLVVVDSDGSDPVTIATGAVDPSEPSWSPDGSRVAYGASNKIFVAATDGSGSGR